MKIAENLKINPRTLSDWKKNRIEIYNRLKWSYEAEHLLKEIELSNDDMQVKVKELLKNK